MSISCTYSVLPVCAGGGYQHCILSSAMVGHKPFGEIERKWAFLVKCVTCNDAQLAVQVSVIVDPLAGGCDKEQRGHGQTCCTY